MDFKTLMYFTSAAETLNFSKTAEAFSVSQTAISLAVSKLESEIGFLLFDRRSRPMSLTESGEFFYERAKKLLKNYEFSVKRGNEINAGFSGSLKVIVPSMFEALVAMGALREHQKKKTGLDITLARVSSARVAESIERHRADAAICCGEVVAGNQEITAKNFLKFTYCVAMHAKHPLAKLRTIPPERLAGAQLVTLQDTSVASDRHIQDFCTRAGLVFKTRRPTDDIESLFFNIGMSDGFGLVPDYFRPYINQEIVCRSIAAEDLPQYQVALCYRKDNKNSALQWLHFALLRAQ